MQETADFDDLLLILKKIRILVIDKLSTYIRT